MGFSRGWEGFWTTWRRRLGRDPLPRRGRHAFGDRLGRKVALDHDRVGLAVRIDEREAHGRTEFTDDRDSGAVGRPRRIDVAVDAGQEALVAAVGIGDVEEE